MSRPIRTQERSETAFRMDTREWTYEEMLELFDADDHGNLVRPLVLRCQDYEGEIFNLNEAIKEITLKYHDLTEQNLRLHFQLQEEQKARASAEEAAMFLFNETNCDYLEAEERWPWLMVVYGCGERDCNERDADPE